VSYTLHLDPTVRWSFEAEGEAFEWLEIFAEAMGLSEDAVESPRHLVFEQLPSKPGDPFGPALGRHLRELRGHNWTFRDLGGISFFEHPAVPEVFCGLQAGMDWPLRIHQMRRSLLPVYVDVVRAGGLPIHGALVESRGFGIILAGRSGEGKSTACLRLPESWHAVSDDMCLVLKSPGGGFRAHPLPTWSALRDHRTLGRCKVGRSLPLRAILFLKQAPEDEFLALRKSAAAVSLASVARQVFRTIDRDYPRVEDSEVNKSLYDNAASMALAVPAGVLRISLAGRFWEKIEEALKETATFRETTAGPAGGGWRRPAKRGAGHRLPA
jgi:SynChlorMet cassette protein ScmC